MSFEPVFMTKFDEYQSEKGKVRTVADWIAFKKRWFDKADWPRLTPQQTQERSRHKRGPVEIGGRTWSYTNFAYDITPEARYEYFFTLSGIGAALAFGITAAQAKTAERGWRQECPFDEISTDEIGDETCPKCGRKLVYTQYADLVESMGQPAARVTDMHTCPMVTGTVPHVGGPITLGSANVLTGNLPQARVGDMLTCVGPPDFIAKGSTGVYVNNIPAARLGDQTAHGGVIVVGLPTVLIGDMGGGGGSGGAAMDFAAGAAQAGVLSDAAKSGTPFCEICFGQ